MASHGLFFGPYGVLLLIKDFRFSLKFFITIIMIANFIYHFRIRVIEAIFILITLFLESMFAKERQNFRKGIIFSGLFCLVKFKDYFPSPTLSRIKTSGEFFVGHREFRAG